MKIGMIGAGKVGFSLGKFFSQGGIEVSGYCSRNPESAKEACAFTNSKYYSTLKDLAEESDAIFITVPDNAITDVYRKISAFEIHDKYICHCSGAMSAEDAFPGIQASGAHGISIHPLFPVSSKYASYQELQDAFFCLEGDEVALQEFTEIFDSLGVKTQRISAENKVLYHAGCVMASNFICALADEGIKLLAECGFSQEGARKALAPLMRSNLEHIIKDGPVLALTGPAERADTGTIIKHLNALEDPQENELYRLLSLKLIGLAEEKHPEADYSALKELLRTNKKEKGNEA